MGAGGVKKSPGFGRPRPLRAWSTDLYEGFIRETLERYPRLRATRILEMLKERGFTGEVRTERRAVARLRPAARPAFLRLSMMPGEQAQVDCAHFGTVRVGRAERRGNAVHMHLGGGVRGSLVAAG